MSKTTRCHRMPFGAEVQHDGSVRFRLWAPAAERLDVCLINNCATGVTGLHDTGLTLLPMTAETEGWYGLTTGLATAGSRYRFCVDGDIQVPDPTSRFQPEDVHGPSEVIDPLAWEWQDTDWRGRPWEDTVIYELHVGSFTPQGSFVAVQEKLDYLLAVGITAIELMPVADFPGERNWGYDGVYKFAPDSRYGRPEALKALVDAAHARGLMVFLDVVYNHFGPEGNYLHHYAPAFFTSRHQTPWGAAINYDDEQSHWVRQFIIHNALYWLEEYHFDGLRLDAVHAIVDDSQPDILTELAQRVHEYFAGSRHIHLMLENDHNAAHYLARDATARPRWYVAQWNDDIHHALHVLLTEESSGYYMDYAEEPFHALSRCLAEGFAYQGESSLYRDNNPRGETSRHLPATAFVSFLQNHDQVGNRAFGERIASLARAEQIRAVSALLLLAPPPPLLFMGEEWGCRQPFAFFCDFGPEFAAQVVAGRRREFARLPQFREPADRKPIPNPMDRQTFEQAVLDWQACDYVEHQHWLEWYRELLSLRQREIIPRLHNLSGQQQACTQLNERALITHWLLGDGSELLLMANLGDTPVRGVAQPALHILYTTHIEQAEQLNSGYLPPWSVTWCLDKKGS